MTVTYVIYETIREANKERKVWYKRNTKNLKYLQFS